MQKWLKSQLQSRVLYRGIHTITFVVIFSILISFSMNFQGYSESSEKIDISKYLDKEGYPFLSEFAEVRETDKLIFEVGKDSKVHVKHVIIGGAWSPENPKVIKMLPGKHSNYDVKDHDGDFLRPIGVFEDNVENSEYIIVGQKPFKAYDLHVSYDLENYLELSDGGLWTKQFSFLHDVEVYFEDDIELIYVNSRPIDISEQKGINCMGCSILLEFFDDEKIVEKKIIRTENKFEEITNIGEEFTIEFLTHGKIEDFNYIEELDYFSFYVGEKNQLISVKIPLELLLTPYSVYHTDIDQEVLAETDKIRKTEFSQTDTYGNVSVRPTEEGYIHIVGATKENHEKLLEKMSSQGKIIDEKLESNSAEDKTESTIENADLYENWGVVESEENNTNDTLFAIIVGVIVAGIIGGIIIKIKKN